MKIHPIPPIIGLSGLYVYHHILEANLEYTIWSSICVFGILFTLFWPNRNHIKKKFTDHGNQ